MDDQRTDRADGGSVGQEADERKTRTISAVICAIFFITFGTWSLNREPTFSSTFMIAFGFMLLVYAVRNHQWLTRPVARWEGPVGGLLGGALIGIATGNWSFLVILAIGFPIIWALQTRIKKT